MNLKMAMNYTVVLTLLSFILLDDLSRCQRDHPCHGVNLLSDEVPADSFDERRIDDFFLREKQNH
jgi:hypothetical protein